jgi:prepilin-type N-terminal cleavage/methylation domain-containing protein
MQERKSRGFTLIELLVVLTILGMLFGIGAIAVNRFTAQGPIAKTQAIVMMTEGLLEQYRNEKGDYPPSSLARLGVRAPNALFEGNEAMVLAFYSKDWNGNRIDEQYLMNLDDDRADKNVSIHGEPVLLEMVDAWGNPLVYLHSSQYEAVHEYEFQSDTSDSVRVQVRAAKNPLTASYYAKESYQLVSVGEDGVYGTDDDIKSYATPAN